MNISTSLTGFAVAALILVLCPDTASAQRGYGPRSGYDHGGPRYVIAESNYGNGTIEGAIRPGPKGWQVRLPRGSWIDCVRSCSDTLRRETVDFWQNQGRDAPDRGRGYFGLEFRF